MGQKGHRIDQKGLCMKKAKNRVFRPKIPPFSGMFLSGIGGTPLPPLTENHPAQKPLAERGDTPTPPLNGKNPLSSFWKVPLLLCFFSHQVTQIDCYSLAKGDIAYDKRYELYIFQRKFEENICSFSLLISSIWWLSSIFHWSVGTDVFVQLQRCYSKETTFLGAFHKWRHHSRRRRRRGVSQIMTNIDKMTRGCNFMRSSSSSRSSTRMSSSPT